MLAEIIKEKATKFWQKIYKTIKKATKIKSIFKVLLLIWCPYAL